LSMKLGALVLKAKIDRLNRQRLTVCVRACV